jgi:peptidoglycan/xylan/chitin deacetylase (PgdA/CDA1 family)
MSAPNFTPTPRFKWPDGASCAVVLCFDVDGETTALEHGSELRNRLTTWSQCAYGPKVGVPRLLELLEHLQIPSTFFVPGYIAEEHPKMLRAIASKNHEIGLHGYLHEKLVNLNEEQEEAILLKSIEILTCISGTRPSGYRAPWFELNPWTPELLQRHGIAYCASAMGDDVPYRHDCGLIEIPGQWMLEDWKQFAFNADPAWGAPPQPCAKVFDLWWEEFEAMHQYGCCFVLTLHPWLSGRPSRVQLLERLIRAIQTKGNVWFARASEVAAWYEAHPTARREVDFDFNRKEAA